MDLFNVNGVFSNPRYTSGAVASASEYTSKTVDPLLTGLLTRIALERPDDVLGYLSAATAGSSTPASLGAIDFEFDADAASEYFDSAVAPLVSSLLRGVVKDRPSQVAAYIHRCIEEGKLTTRAPHSGVGLPEMPAVLRNALKLDGVFVELSMVSSPTGLTVVAFDPKSRQETVATMTPDDDRYAAVMSYRSSLLHHLSALATLDRDPATGALSLAWKGTGHLGEARGVRWDGRLVQVGLVHRGDGVEVSVFEPKTKRHGNAFMSVRDSNYVALASREGSLLRHLPEAASLADDGEDGLSVTWKAASSLLGPSGVPSRAARGIRWGGRLVEVAMLQRATDSVEIVVHDPRTRSQGRCILSHSDPNFVALAASEDGMLGALPRLADLVLSPSGDIVVHWHSPSGDRPASAGGVRISGIFVEVEFRFTEHGELEVKVYDPRSRVSTSSTLARGDPNYEALAAHGDVMLAVLGSLAGLRRDTKSRRLSLHWNTAHTAHEAKEDDAVSGGIHIGGVYYIVTVQPSRDGKTVSLTVYEPLSSCSGSVTVESSSPPIADILAGTDKIDSALKGALEVAYGEPGRLAVAWCP